MDNDKNRLYTINDKEMAKYFTDKGLELHDTIIDDNGREKYMFTNDDRIKGLVDEWRRLRKMSLFSVKGGND